MTQKELLYLEDAIGHEGNIISICTETLNMLEDEKLINFLSKELTKHETMQNKLIEMLKEKANE